MNNKKVLVSFCLFALCLELHARIPVQKNAETTSDFEAVDTVCFNLENTIVHTYMVNAAQAYQEGIGRDGVSILNYRVLGADAAPYIFQVVEHDYDLPNWAEQTGTVSIVAPRATKIIVSPDSKFNVADTLLISTVSDTTRVFNLVPNNVYWYRAINSSNTIVKEGIVKTSGQVRMIRTQKVNNIRDMGGWPCSGGGHIVYGRLYRGGKLNNFDEEIGTAIGPEDIYTLGDFCGVGADLDLRNSGLTISPLGCEIKNINMSAYMYLLTNTDNRGVSQHYYSELSKALKYIVEKLEAGKNIYMHCSLGADRTGSVAAILEAICGVAEADIVKDFELTSFSSLGQFKYIDREENSYYHYVDGQFVKDYAEMRSMFNYWYENYGGESGATIEQQVVAWLKAKVFDKEPDSGTSIIQNIKNLLVEPDSRGPLLIRDLSSRVPFCYYSVSEENTINYASQDCLLIDTNTGQGIASEACSSTDYIDCSGYSYLFVNLATEHIAAFYDKNHQYIGGCGNSAVSQQYGTGTVIFENSEYSIPQGAAFVRLTMPHKSGFLAVLSTRSYL